MILIAVVFGLPNLGGVMTTEMDLENNPESVVGEQVIEDASLADHAPTTETIVIQSRNGMTVDDPKFQGLTQRVTDELRALLASWNSDAETSAPFANYYELVAAGDPGRLVGPLNDANLGSFPCRNARSGRNSRPDGSRGCLRQF